MKVSTTYSAMLTDKFDFAIDNAAGKWSTPQETFKYRTQELAKVADIEADYPYDVITTRVRVRGSGEVMLLHYESTDGKDFVMAGRVTPFTAATES